MSHRVIVQPEFRVPHGLAARDAEIVLDDESALALQNSRIAVVAAALSAGGPSAAFNRRQVPRLLEELRAVAAGANRAVQANLNDIAQHIEDRLSGRTDAFVYFVADE